KGSNDPFALRRAAIQIVENLIANEVQFDLRSALQSVLPLMPIPADEQTVEQVLRFIDNRLEIVLITDGIR
ncbi:MAG: glycine--tRNA ligase subunit beta, partial [Gammaproteobacteria bacterium]|nr:glycine--tRNA ligase subunit beta [Phycisphaerae bacterium]NIQ08576.1 glycine--tRNA ligase subunit beta [Gammaproteobacteria bacterium]NIX26207.1 glycine--tRNA ligase subunit beta [Phycisphaerae bacterium]